MNKRIIEIDAGFWIETDNVLSPGHYQDERAARYAFSFSKQELKELAEMINSKALTHGITYEMLREKANQR